MVSFALLLMLAAQADWPDAGDWAIDRFEERCVTSLDFEGAGATELYVTLELDGSSTVLINNANWTTVDDQRYPDVEVVLDDQAYTGGGARGYISEGYRRGLTMRMPATFVDDFAAARSFKVFNGEQLVDSLSLDGSAGAASGLRRCITSVRRAHDAAERERQRLAHIPENPFAEVTPPEPTTSEDGVQWARRPQVTADDFPAHARERDVTGSATLSCEARANGSSTNCRVLSENPSGVGFGRAALAVVGRARLAPQYVDRLPPDSRFTVTVPFELGRP
ncbi:energy transducer TonB [Brevundimonas albigilva]|uniref:Energy transducer TonB n=1 Tax=Brevundimonas albigilva TaxID=1312364 RepID=A0ABY4SK43_9CAUL|nr:TonB family protein [Brevundimonas albigilva]UQV19632.1 energy transducer TonB [Brevundimonas albigilva]URI15342.1 energy transducer TonB [Brevundimonas albigilva]